MQGLFSQARFCLQLVALVPLLLARFSDSSNISSLNREKTIKIKTRPLSLAAFLTLVRHAALCCLMVSLRSSARSSAMTVSILGLPLRESVR